MNNKYLSERRLQKRGKSAKLSQLKQRLYQNNSKKKRKYNRREIFCLFAISSHKTKEAKC